MPFFLIVCFLMGCLVAVKVESMNKTITEVKAACFDAGAAISLSDADIARIVAVKKRPASCVATALRFDEMRKQFDAECVAMPRLSKALGSGWLWPAAVTGNILCAKLARLTSDHTPEDLALGLYTALEWLLRAHPFAASSGVTVLVNMEGAGVQAVEKLVRQHTVGRLCDIFARDTYPMRIRAVYVYHCSSICSLAVRAARSYLPTKLRERVLLLKTTEVEGLVPEFEEATQLGAFETWWHEAALPAFQQRRRKEKEEGRGDEQPAAAEEVAAAIKPDDVRADETRPLEELSYQEEGAMPAAASPSPDSPLGLEAADSVLPDSPVAAAPAPASAASSALTTPTKSCDFDASLLSDLSSDDDDELEVRAFKLLLKEEAAGQQGIHSPQTPDDFQQRYATMLHRRSKLKGRYSSCCEPAAPGSVSELSLKPLHQRRLTERRHQVEQEEQQLRVESDFSRANIDVEDF